MRAISSNITVYHSLEQDEGGVVSKFFHSLIGFENIRTYVFLCHRKNSRLSRRNYDILTANVFAERLVEQPINISLIYFLLLYQVPNFTKDIFTLPRLLLKLSQPFGVIGNYNT